MKPPLLVITGAAGAGKTTASRAVAATVPGVLAIDGDVLAAGARAARDRDYVAYWGYVVTVAAEVAANGLVPLVGQLCRPGQVLANDLSGFAHLSVLGLTCESSVRVARAESRATSIQWRTAVAEHDEIDAELRGCALERPHRYARLDTTALPLDDLVSGVLAWVRREAGCG